MNLTPKEIEKIIDLIKTKDVANVRLARALIIGCVPEEIKSIIFTVFSKEIYNTYDDFLETKRLRIMKNGIVFEAISFLADDAIHLNLGFIGLESLPDSLQKFVHLKDLVLWSNQITEIPEYIGSFKELEYLEMSNNKLTHLPESIGQLRKLKELGIGHNPFISLPNSMRELKRLEILWLTLSRDILPKDLLLLPDLGIIGPVIDLE